MKYLKQLWPYLAEHKRKVWVVCIGSIIFALLRLVDPYLYKIAIDDVLVKLYQGQIELAVGMRIVIWACIIFLGAKILTSLIYAFYTYFSLVVYFRIEGKMYYESKRHLQSLDIAFHHGQNTGDLMSRVERGIAGATKILHEEISRNILPNGLNVILLLSFIFYWDWRLSSAAIFFLPAHVYFSVRNAVPITKEQTIITKLQDKLSHLCYEAIANIEAVISFNSSQRELEAFQRVREEIYERQLKTARVWRVVGFSASFFEVLGRMSVLVMGTWLIASKSVTPGEIVMFLVYMAMLYNPLFELIISSLRVKQELPKVERFTDLMNVAPKVINLSNAVDMSPLRGSIEFKNVSFVYEGAKEALVDIDLKITAGKKVALVGKSGAGKSTLANMVQRYYDPTSGIIAFDGTDLRKFKLESVHREVTIVSQQPWLFSRSIKENIAYGRPEATDEEIKQAAIAANAHNFIMEKLDGYETLIGEDGVRLSGGEQQRISIARAILCNASVIIMDEATSHLDSENEALIQEAIGRLTKNKTMIIIAHRLSTVLGADMIVVMDGGRIVDAGTNEELLSRCQIYQRLYNRQFKDE